MSSSNLEHDPGPNNFLYDHHNYLNSNGDNVLDPALSQVQPQFQGHPDHLVGQGLAVSADHHHVQQQTSFNQHWDGYVAESGGDTYALNQFDNSYYHSDPYSTFHGGQLSANYFNQPQSSQPPQPWQSFDSQPDLAQAQSIAPQDLTANQPSAPAPQSQVTTAGATTHWPLPPGTQSDIFKISTVKDLESKYSCEKVKPFVHVGLKSVQTTITQKALPTYIPRKSRNEISTLLANDSSLRSTHKGRGARAPTTSTSATSRVSTTKRRPNSSGGASSNDESDLGSSEDEEEEGPPLPAVRPSNPTSAISYDTIKATWLPPHKTATRQQITKGLEQFWEIINTIRRRWKSDAAAVDAAKQRKDKDLPELQGRVAKQRQLFDLSLKAVLKYGHRDVIEHFGRHLLLMKDLAMALLDLTKELEWSVDVAKSTLEVLSRCTEKIAAETVEKLNLLKLATRFMKRGDDTVKAFAKIVVEHTGAALKNQKKEVDKPAPTAASPPSNTSKKTSASTSSPVPGSKRPREDDTQTNKSSKKPTGNSSMRQASTVVKNPPSASATKIQPSPATTKKITTKPTNFFASLQPAYKKNTTASSSGPTTASKPAASAVDKKPSQAGAPAPTFSFAATMANLTRPKEAEPVPKKKESTPPETEEEKSRRLRKEKRRGLRVSFKPDNDLVQIRVFEHHPDEEVEHNASEVRDVKDLEGEGRMFKINQRAKQQLRNDPNRVGRDEDDEEEDEQDSDQDLKKEYVPPSQIDFSDVPSSERDKNYAPYGGGRNEPISAEAAIQQSRESETLVVVYAQPSDIPPSPKEPPFQAGEQSNPKLFGTPPERVLGKLKPSVGSQQPELPDLSAILGSITQTQTSQPHQAQQQPTAFNPIDINKIVAQLSQTNGQQVQSAPQHLQPHIPPWNPMFPAASQPPPVQQQPQFQVPNSQEISALLASLQGQGHLTMPISQNQPSSLPQQASQSYENEDRKRLRETGYSQPNKKQRQFILPCKYWPEGKCAKGANCTYRHDLA